MPQDTGRKQQKTPMTEMQTLEEQIRCRAFELYEGRGREAGHELDDWLRAEEEIMNKNGRTAAA